MCQGSGWPVLMAVVYHPGRVRAARRADSVNPSKHGAKLMTETKSRRDFLKQAGAGAAAIT
ncbi:MAG: twin-arginine translocation signal domain-containing protein, partial [Acidobacteria bacterium]|nr:twin-arginine translocation signal domain-containing protein [Acidobacteriota bacterium]